MTQFAQAPETSTPYASIPSNVTDSGSTSRRSFLKYSGIAMAAGMLNTTVLRQTQAIQPYGDRPIRLGLIGCGGRGVGAVANIMETRGPTVLVAVADAFAARVDDGLKMLKRDYADYLDVPPERRFVGLQSYHDVVNADVDLVILAAPPGFRPPHFEAAINAGKHVFMEKPVAVDPWGVRRVLAAGEIAAQKQLAVAVGLQRRHEPRYIETIKRLQDGAIGDLVALRVYWNSDGVWTRNRQPNQTELEYQVNNWYYFNWLCGDHIVEQHIHNIDVGNWAKNAYPVQAAGMGGREVRNGPDHGQIFDHHAVEYTFADGTKMFSQCRHMPNTAAQVAEFAHGTKGFADVSGAKIYDHQRQLLWEYGSGGGDGHQQEQHDLMAQLRSGDIPNEAEYGALSTLTAIMGRMATYTGQVIELEQAMAQETPLAHVDQLQRFDDPAPVLPDEHGRYPVPQPGVSSLI